METAICLEFRIDRSKTSASCLFEAEELEHFFRSVCRTAWGLSDRSHKAQEKTIFEDSFHLHNLVVQLPPAAIRAYAAWSLEL